MKAAIVGLGLMGGSLGLSLKKMGSFSKILGFDHNITHCEEALALNLVDEIVSLKELKSADVIFLAIPVEGIIKVAQNLKDIDKNSTIIDLGSTKEKIVKSIPKEIRTNFVAAHPMTGTEKFGPSAAMEDLYTGKVVVLCDLENSGSLHKDRAINIFTGIGMKLVFMNSYEHDYHAAFISHLPHAISYALANSVMNQEDPKNILSLAAGGFKDMSRIAKSSPKMWTDIFKQNRKNLLKSIELFQKEIEYSKKLIENQKWNELEKWMEEATTLHKIL